jgi:uncharacterized repeat protein (TIGR01451 family)
MIARNFLSGLRFSLLAVTLIAGAAATLPAQAASLRDNASFVSLSYPPTARPGEAVQVFVSMKNMGNQTWSNNGGKRYALIAQPAANATLWGVTSLPIQQDVPPRATVTFKFTVIVPRTQGRYVYQWRMTEQNTGTFGQLTPPQYVNVSGATATSRAACADGLDNDRDGHIDYPNDPGCTSYTDNDESDYGSSLAACADGRDNDSDGRTDYPNDPGCTSYTDNDESDYGTTGQADIAISLSAPSSLNRDDYLSYSVKLRNNGPDTAPQNLSFLIPVPSNYTYDADRSNGNCTWQGTYVRCGSINNLRSGQERVITVSMKPVSSYSNCSYSLQNQAYLEPQAGDYNTANNQSSLVYTSIQCNGSSSSSSSSIYGNGADLALTQTATVNGTNGISYQLTVRNNGPYYASNVVLHDPIPGNLTYLQSNDSVYCSKNGSVVECRNFGLNAGETRTFNLSFTAAGCSQQTIVNAPYVTSDTTDPSNGNNQVSNSNTLSCSGNGAVGISVSAPSAITRGNTFQASVTLTNSNVSSNNVVVTLPLPTGLTLQTYAANANCALNGNVITCNGMNLTANETRTLSLVIGNTAVLGCGASIGLQPTVQVNNDAGTARSDFTNVSIQCGSSSSSSSSSVSSSSSSSSAAGTLSVAQKIIGTSASVLRGQQNVTMIAFEARAQNQAIVLDKLQFAATDGTLSNASGYALWIDSSGDGFVDAILPIDAPSVQNGVLTIDISGQGRLIAANQTVRLELHANIAGAPQSNVLQIGFAVAGTTYVQAKIDNGATLAGIRTNGACSGACDITVVTAASIRYTIIDQVANLFITKDTTPLRTHQLLGGMLGDAVMRLLLRAQNDDIDVTHLELTVEGTGSTVGTINSVDRLELFRDGETTAFAMATVAGCGALPGLPANTFCATFSGPQEKVTVPRDLTRIIIVRPRLKDDVSGAVTGEEFRVKLRAQQPGSGTGAVMARGVTTGAALNQNNGNSAAEGEIFIGVSGIAPNATVYGNAKNVVVLSKIASITNANPDQDGSMFSFGLLQFGQFKIAAASHANSRNGLNKVVLGDLIFTVQAQNTTLDGTKFAFWNKSNASVKAPCSAYQANGTLLRGQATGTFYVVCQFIDIQSSVNTAIDQGTDATFVLEGEVTNARVSSAQTSMLQASLDTFSDPSKSVFGLNDSHFTWEDRDNGSATTHGYTWVENGDTVIRSTRYAQN